ncbi:MAG: ABC transporter permease [Balneolaceae bacterium]|nr:ABC transporter permease [Balneolaceae bacterium]
MLWNHIKISLRNIRRHKLFSAVNVISLTLSFTICLAVLMVVKNQLDFDAFHPNADRTYRVITETTRDQGPAERYATAPLPLTERLQDNLPSIEHTVRILGQDIHYGVLANGRKLSGVRAFSEPSFFKVFGFGLRHGHPGTALAEPRSVVLTPETARRFFGDGNPVGETFDIDGSDVYTVTGVLERSLEHSHLSFDFLVSLNTLTAGGRENVLDNWQNLSSARVYVQLAHGTGASRLEQALAPLAEEVNRNQQLPEGITAYGFTSQGLTDITPGQNLQNEMTYGKIRSSSELLILFGIAMVLLLMACFNYTNLSIAQALRRSLEVGIYKLFGARRRQIVGQFVVQAILIAAASLIFAYALLPFVPLPNTLAGEIRSVIFDARLLAWMALFSVVAGLLAGGLPAWMLSAMQPVKVLKGLRGMNLMKGISLRKFLVTLQFAISIVLLITASVVYQQSQFAATTDYGFRQENIYNLSLQNEVDPQLMKDELTSIPGVEMVSSISRPFGLMSSPESFYLDPEGEGIHGDMFPVDRHAVPNLELELVAGQNFTLEMEQAPGNHVLVNEHFLTVTEWETPAEALGETIYWREQELEILGVVKDFNYRSVEMPIRPLILPHLPGWARHLQVRVTDGMGETVAARVEEAWNRVAPQLPLDYRPFSRDIYRFHANEQTVASLGYYALIALSIACLGLLGMVTYTVQVRTREVGIRKVLGAGMGSVLGLLSREFVLLLAIATGIGLPAGYWLGQLYLNNFAYHISIGFGILFTGFAVMAGLGLLAIGWQTWQVARRNPVEAIRSE